MEPYNVSIGSLDWLNTVKDTKYRGWVDILHHAWTNLAFKFNTDILCEGCVSSTLPVERPFVVPGGRFREFYYWDSYFVIEGLLQSGLNDLALGMIENFFDLVERYGFMRKFGKKSMKDKSIHCGVLNCHFILSLSPFHDNQPMVPVSII